MEQRQYTRWERFSNWFSYNKWYLAVGAVVLYVLGSMVWNVLGIGQTKPDHWVAYVGARRLPEDCVTALEGALAQYGEDVNGDGIVSVRLTQHITAGGSSTENMVYGYAAEVTLLADITQGESHFFLVEDPDAFQRNFQVLADLDGSIPSEGDLTGMDKVLAWSQCPALSGLDLGSYTDTYLDQTETGDCQDLLSGLYLGRRFYYDPKQSDDPAPDGRMWDRMTQGARP